MKSILNLTQHKATAEQIAAGVFDCPEPHRTNLVQFLTFEELPSKAEVFRRAMAIAGLAKMVGDEMGGVDAAMIGGAPYLMAPLEAALEEVGIQPLYAFTVRESVETVMPGGTVQKTAIFRHAGFVEA